MSDYCLRQCLRTNFDPLTSHPVDHLGWRHIRSPMLNDVISAPTGTPPGLKIAMENPRVNLLSKLSSFSISSLRKLDEEANKFYDQKNDLYEAALLTRCYSICSSSVLTVLRRWSRCCFYSVWFCGLYYGALHVLKSSRALCPRVSSFLLALWSPCLGKRELVYVLLVHLFVCFVRVCFCLFFSSSWCRVLAAVCDCGTPWAFLFFFLQNFSLVQIQAESRMHTNSKLLIVQLPRKRRLKKYFRAKPGFAIAKPSIAIAKSGFAIPGFAIAKAGFAIAIPGFALKQSILEQNQVLQSKNLVLQSQ